MTRVWNERGFTLAEILVATVIIVTGLVAVATGFQFATAGIATGRGETAAIFLAEQRVEQLKAVAIANFDGPWPTGPSLAAGTTTEFCLTSNIGSTASNCQTSAVTGAAAYQRDTTVSHSGNGLTCADPAPTAPNPVLCKRIRVRVTYRPVTSRGDTSQLRQIDVVTVVVPRS